MTRVVSLVPSITETLLAWGVRPVGVTRFCDAPGLEKVGGTKNPDLAAIVALRPDVVFMDKEENRAPDADELSGAGVRVLATHVRALADVNPALAALRQALDLPSEPPPVLDAAGSGFRPKVFVPIWRRPWMTIGRDTYGSSLLSAAGIDNVFADSDDPYPTIDLDAAAARHPRAVLAPSEPYPFKERHRAELERVGEVLFVDGRDLFWWGARSAAALGRLKEMAGPLGRA